MMAYRDNKWKEEGTFYFESIIWFIDHLCKQHKVTKAWLAREIGVKPRTFANWYQGIANCPHPYLVSMALEHIAYKLRNGDYE